MSKPRWFDRFIDPASRRDGVSEQPAGGKGPGVTLWLLAAVAVILLTR